MRAVSLDVTANRVRKAFQPMPFFLPCRLMLKG